MSIPVCINAVLTFFGVLAVGHFVWHWLEQQIKSHLVSHGFKEHVCLKVGIFWFLGYFYCEIFLYLLAFLHFFHPLIIIIFGICLNGWGLVWLGRQLRGFRFFENEDHPFAWVVLSTLAGFVFFWNLYPTFDIDSVSGYFAFLKNTLSTRGLSFSPFNDIRLSLPSGENLIFSLGFAWQLDSTLFAQLIHGISKVMFMVTVYGTARSMGLGTLALIAPALIASEEHLVASGANRFVHINIPLTMGVFFLFLGFFVYFKERRAEYLCLTFLSVYFMLMIKFIGLVYLLISGVVLITIVVLHPSWVRNYGN